MKPWPLEDLRRAAKGKWLMRGESPRPFNGAIATDSRKASEGNLFIPIKGERFDAHDFLPDVIQRRVAAIFTHRDADAGTLALAKEHNVALIRVDNTLAALNRLAAAYRANEFGGGGFRAKVIAVGGSNGKTTTKRIIHTLLAEKFGPHGGHASPKSFNNNIGMPLTLLEVTPAHEYVILEIGTNAPGEIAALGEVCRPDVALITSIGLEHLEKLIDLRGVALEEAAIAGHVMPAGMLIIPDVPELLAAWEGSKVRRLLVGAGKADLVLTEPREAADGTAFSVNGRGSFFVPLVGAHNAMNALMAIAVARRFGLTDEQIAAGLAKVRPAEGRMEKLQIGTWPVINDAYNANPTSMAAALRTFANFSQTMESGAERGEGGGRQSPGFPSGVHEIAERGRKVIVLGDMLELGTASDAMHREIGAAMAQFHFDLFIAIGPAMRIAADAAASSMGVPPVIVRFENTPAAQKEILALLKPHDAILLKGSHGMHLETLLETLRSGIDNTSKNLS